MDKKIIVGLVIGLVIATGVTIYAATDGFSVNCVADNSCVFNLSRDSKQSEIDVPSNTATSEVLGGQRGGLQQFQDGITLDNVTTSYKTGTIGSGVAQGSWCNTGISKDVYVDLIELRTKTDVASSSMTINVATSSVATLTDPFTDPNGTLVDARVIATSTPTNTVISNIGNGLALRQTIQVPVDVCVNISFVSPRMCVGGSDTSIIGNAGKCDAATSTTRGFDLDWFIRYHYKQ